MNTSKLFFDLYHVLPAQLSSLALSTLVQITSVRRSLLTNVEREKFLGHLVKGIKNILDNPTGLSDPGNFHEFCRLLARLKTNFQLVELVYVDVYPETIALITTFTVQSLQMWQFTPNSIHYLLALWQRMVASVQFFRDPKPHLLETYTPEVTTAYIKSRLDSVPIILRDGLEDPLEDLGMVTQQLEQLSVVMRCEYEKTVTLLVGLFDLVSNLIRGEIHSWLGINNYNNCADCQSISGSVGHTEPQRNGHGGPRNQTYLVGVHYWIGDRRTSDGLNERGA